MKKGTSVDARVRKASPDEIESVAAVMDLGFVTDPTARYFLPRAEQYFHGHRQYARLCAAPGFDSGTVFAFSMMMGAAIWYPPGIKADYAALEELVQAVVQPEQQKLFSDLIEACVRYRPNGDFASLELIAVDPAHSGNGVGAALLREGLTLFDQKGVPVYLESSNPRNLSFYRRAGFDLLAEVRVGDGPARYPMLRPAGGRTVTGNGL
ncbi:GNAT family N-acetyltransferase [Defluviimonas sp. WL0002]|uniref:GNAT family N-acetyltransferase n=1 Tax=Albidovulum marisflavi TaxID=2984159 RepID=A0ABT2ZFA2_9RHOB|nr:GNAT family N-acetyltransferase [Defluviimonas sp. WL0002]MCV2869804.1 GNAT family N-acetyltransferase [Defluviimonas sp. WL0002]